MMSPALSETVALATLAPTGAGEPVRLLITPSLLADRVWLLAGGAPPAVVRLNLMVYGAPGWRPVTTYERRHRPGRSAEIQA